MEKAPLAHCDDCPLRDLKHVNGHGPDKAELVIVGEAPGQQEVAQGVPFTGKSGQLLDKILAYHGIDRDKVYVTNTVLCRPPDNRTPSTKEIRACRDRLIKEVKDRDPKMVLALGNSASKTLLDTREGITDLRVGADPKRSPFLQAGVIPTFHPAAAFRQPDLFPSIVTDVKKVNRVELGYEPTKYVVADNIDQAGRLLRRQLQMRQLTLDIEVDIPTMKRIDPKNPRWLCIGISHRPGAAVVYDRQVVESEMYQNLLSKGLASRDIKWIGQNYKFDVQHLWSFAPEARVDGDTMLMHYSTDERKGTHDLEQLSSEYLGAPAYKSDAKKHLPRKGASMAFLPPEVLHRYNATDVDNTHRLIEPLQREMASDGVERPYNDLLIPGSNALARAEYVGVKVDLSYLGTVEQDLLQELSSKEAFLKAFVDNPRSPKQVKEALHQLGFPVEGTAKDILKELDHEFPKAILDHRSAAKLLSTYVRGLEQCVIRSRVHPTFLLHGTETGRLSCRRPNLQNIPTGSTIRNAFVSGKGTVLLSADYNQVEFRLLAVFSGDEWLKEQFLQGRQFHKEVALRLYGPNYTGLQYLRAKAQNFGLIYGRGAASLAAEHGGDVREWQRTINEWFSQMPEVKRYHRQIERDISEKGYLDSYFGRKRRFWLVTRDNKHEVIKEGYNFDLQGTASDLNLLSLIRLEPILRDKAVPVISVHDQGLWEVKVEYLEEVAHTVKEVMEDVPIDFPCPVDLKVGTQWGNLKEYTWK